MLPTLRLPLPPLPPLTQPPTNYPARCPSLLPASFAPKVEEGSQQVRLSLWWPTGPALDPGGAPSALASELGASTGRELVLFDPAALAEVRIDPLKDHNHQGG